MEFDLVKARADGVSDSQIAEFLAQKHGFDLGKARADHVPDTQIVEFLAKKAPEGTPRPLSEDLLGHPSNVPSNTVAENRFDPTQPVGGYLMDKIRKGYASLWGFPGDILNLGTNAVAGKTPFGGTKLAEQLMGVQGLRPPNTEAQLGGSVVQNATLAIPYAGWAGRAGSITRPLVELAAGAGAGAGGWMAQQAKPNSMGAEIFGQLAGSAPIYRAANIVGQVSKLAGRAGTEATQQTTQLAQNQVAEDIRKAVATQDPTQIKAAVDKYLQIRALIPNFNVGLGEILENPTLLSMERELAGKNISTLTAAGALQRGNEQALQTAKPLVTLPAAPTTQHLPTLQGAVNRQRTLLEGQQSQVNEALAGLQQVENVNKQQIAAQALPVADVGPQLTGIRGELLSEAKATAAGHYNAFRDALGTQAQQQIPATSIMQTIGALRAEDPAAQRMPALFNTVSQLQKTEEAAPAILNAAGQPIKPQQPLQNLSVDDLLSVQRAIGRDIRFANTVARPDRELIRRLSILDNEVTSTLNSNLPSDVKDLYSKAKNYYKEEVIPKFYEGVNYKQALPDAYGDAKIRPEQVVSSYFKPGDTSNAQRFNTLFGQSDEAKALLHSGVMDLYAKEVLEKGGGVARHEAFVQKYSTALKEYPWISQSLQNESTTLHALATQQSLLRENAQKIADSKISRVLQGANVDDVLNSAMQSPQNMGALIVKMPREDRQAVVTAVMERGWQVLQSGGAGKFNAWLSSNDATLKTLLYGTYGKEAATKHFQNIQDVTKATEMVERSPISEINASAVKQSEDLLQSSAGISIKSIWAALRAMGQRRVSPEYTAGVFAGQYLGHITGEQYSQMLRQQLYEPQTLQAFLDAGKGNPAALKQWRDKFLDFVGPLSGVGHALIGKGVPTSLAKKIPTYGTETRTQEEPQ